MADEDKATSRPWKLARTTVTNGGWTDDAVDIFWIAADDAAGEGVADLYYRTTGGAVVAKRNSEANAALIVRAVNAHDDLVEALTEVRDNLLTTWPRTTLAKINAAIERATQAPKVVGDVGIEPTTPPV